MNLKDVMYRIINDFELGEEIKDFVFIGASTYIEGEDEKIKKWEINYYDKKNKILKIVINENYEYELHEYEIGNEISIPSKDIYNIDEEKAMDIAKKEYEEKYKGYDIIGVLVALDMIKEEWVVSLITKQMKALSFIIDMNEGELKQSKEVVLAHAI